MPLGFSWGLSDGLNVRSKPHRGQAKNSPGHESSRPRAKSSRVVSRNALATAGIPCCRRFQPLISSLFPRSKILQTRARRVPGTAAVLLWLCCCAVRADTPAGEAPNLDTVVKPFLVSTTKVLKKFMAISGQHSPLLLSTAAPAASSASSPIPAPRRPPVGGNALAR